MLNLTAMATALKEKTAWQALPEELEDSQYLAMILHGLRRLFIDTGRALQFNVMKLTTLEDGSYAYDQRFEIDEEEYVLLCAQLEFFAKVQAGVNDQVSYSTDALSVTNADKPYANIKSTMDNIENERRIIFHKMVRFTLGD